MKKIKGPGEMTGGQVRMARAALRWSIAETAKRAGIGESTVKAIEKATDAAIDGGPAQTLDYRQSARQQALEALYLAFTAAGVVFVAEGGKEPCIGVLRLTVKGSRD